MLDVTFQHGSFFDDVKENSYDVAYDVRSPFLLLFFSSGTSSVEKKKKKEKNIILLKNFMQLIQYTLFILYSHTSSSLSLPPTHTHT